MPLKPMTSDEIRSTYLEFFEARDHLRLPSASLVPAEHDPSALFTVAGMHPLKPYFQGVETPPRPRVTTCQKTFRTVDIDIIGTTSRHLTFFEMLGNFSFGDYFKREAARFAWELSTDGFGFPADQIWITVFAGDDELGLGPDQEAIEAWLEIGVPRERIVECERSENFWQAGPTGPCGPCSELYLDRGLEFGKPDDLPGGDNERFLEYWNLVFMQFDQNPVNTLTPLPAKNIDTGLGLNRLASITQGKPSIFETDQFWPLIELGEEMSGRRYGQDYPTDRALRLLADHSRAMTLPDRRRRGPVERGSRLRAAPDHAPRDPAGPLARARPRLPVRLRRPRHRDHGIRVRRAPPAARLDPEVARVRGGGLRPDARAGPQAARRADRARAADRRRGDRRRRRVPAARHLRVPDRPDARARGRA